MEIQVNAIVKYNEISDYLKDIVKQALPKKGQTIYFESVRPKARGTTVLPQDRIFDPGKKEFIDIAYVVGNIAGKGPEFGRIQFRKADGGRISITGGNNRDEALFTYLFLTNQKHGNNNEEWFVSAQGRSPVFKLLKPSQTAADKIKFERKVRMACEAIDSMGNNVLRDFALGLDMKNINQFSDPDEIRIKLYEIAKKNPDKVAALDKDRAFQTKITVKEAEKFGIIKSDPQLKQYTWPDSGEAICIIPPEKDLREGLIMFLMSSKGMPTFELIQKLVDDKKNRADAPQEAPPQAPTTFTASAGNASVSIDNPKPKGGRPAGSKNKAK